jgi:hypothetical protein
MELELFVMNALRVHSKVVGCPHNGCDKWLWSTDIDLALTNTRHH